MNETPLLEYNANGDITYTATCSGCNAFVRQQIVRLDDSVSKQQLVELRHEIRKHVFETGHLVTLERKSKSTYRLIPVEPKQPTVGIDVQQCCLENTAKLVTEDFIVDDLAFSEYISTLQNEGNTNE